MKKGVNFLVKEFCQWMALVQVCFQNDNSCRVLVCLVWSFEENLKGDKRRTLPHESLVSHMNLRSSQ